MEQLLEIMLPPFVACLILTGIHTYLGLHVVSRGVIFVDLALAQIAALGSTFAFLLGFDPSSQTGYFYSLGFTFLGAAIFSISRLKDQRIPQEALIGIVFAVSSSAAILIADRAPQGAEHVEEMLTGAILWVSWPTIWKTFLIYCAIGVFHVVFRKRFLLISMQPQQAEQTGVTVRWWDFLFYMSFGFVITSSVAIAGVLLVFSFLIVPSVIGMLYSERIGTRLAIGWFSGTVVSLAGLVLSYEFDFPSGPSIVCSFGAFLILAGIAQYILRAEHTVRAVARVGIGTTLALFLLLLATQFSPPVSDLETSEESRLARVLQAFSALESPGGSPQEALSLLGENQDLLKQGLDGGQIEIQQETVQRLGGLGLSEAVPILRLVCDSTADPWMRFYASAALLDLGETEGIHRLIELLSDPAPAFLKAQVRDRLRDVAGEDFGFDPTKSVGENRRSINRWEVWWHEHADQMTWDTEAGKFEVAP